MFDDDDDDDDDGDHIFISYVIFSSCNSEILRLSMYIFRILAG